MARSSYRLKEEKLQRIVRTAILARSAGPSLDSLAFLLRLQVGVPNRMRPRRQ
jgi:hypothetical protein